MPNKKKRNSQAGGEACAIELSNEFGSALGAPPGPATDLGGGSGGGGGGRGRGGGGGGGSGSLPLAAVSIGGLVSTSGPPAAQQLPGEQAAMIAALQASHGGLSSLADGPHGGLIERHAHLSGTHISQAEVTVAALQRLAALEAWPEMCRVDDLE